MAFGDSQQTGTAIAWGKKNPTFVGKLLKPNFLVEIPYGGRCTGQSAERMSTGVAAKVSCARGMTNSHRDYFIGHGLGWVSDGWQFGSGGKASAGDISMLRDNWVMLVDLQMEIRKQPRIQRCAGVLL